jgi:SAM-dependent methyltransferase
VSKAYYDQVPYTSQAYIETHPALLEAFGYLHGIDPPPIRSSRVLELGCASGGNLLPIAYSLPESRCLGVDFSERQVARGQKVIQGVGLTNAELRCQSILDFPRDAGPFDYIICHGVYSWVPVEVQDAIMGICRDCMAPNGVAFISFNVLPGWYLKLWLRQALLLLGKDVADPDLRVRRGVEFLDFLVTNEPHASMPISALIKQDLQWLKGRPSSYVLHEYLEEVNDPIYFQEFAARLARHGLVYMADGRVNGINVPNHPVMQRFLTETASDRVLREQYMDFLTNRAFRRALVVRAGQPIDFSQMERRLENMQIMSHCKPASVPPQGTSVPELKFPHPTAGHISTRDNGMMAGLLHLAKAAPQATTVRELLEVIQGGKGMSAEQFAPVRQMMIRELLQYVMTNLAHVYLSPPRFGAVPSEKPRVSALARFCSQSESRVTSLRHEPVDLDAQSAVFVQLCDGTRSVADLVAAMPGANEQMIRSAIGQLVKQALLEA